MKISCFKLSDSNDNVAMGQRIQDVAQWPQGIAEPEDKHFDPKSVPSHALGGNGDHVKSGNGEKGSA